MALAGGADLTPVWRNGLGGVTFRWADRHAKWQPAAPAGFFDDEARRLRWAEGRTPVPRVVSTGSDENGAWLVTATVPGTSAVDPRWAADPDTAVRAIGAGLRALHDALPVAGCPFDWGVPARIARAAARGVVVPASLVEAPPVDRLVVCHGDACAPNTLVGDDGRWTAHVDLGALGVADRWADLAIATWSTVWNYGPGHEDALLDAYGIAPDDVRTAYYRALWDAT
ncbi:aminoglycoside 3'-phosphotransferase [Cellulomonas composti]|uniref:Putative phosphotransferase n=1 Tax=Cellulomonas composti TaxID=266130 RepID=A0A511J994_9CELL|nr:aminoglycoside 3'-phosphotransferase [Cellulomonas composti]GEL94560.1 putative phosphotransferase [Cellulomonas composti]